MITLTGGELRQWNDQHIYSCCNYHRHSCYRDPDNNQKCIHNNSIYMSSPCQFVFFVELVDHAVRAAAPWIPPWAHALELQLLVLGVLQQGSPWVCWSRVIIIIMLVMVTQHIPTMTKSHNGGKMSATMKMGMCQCQKPTIHHTL